jgi:hypothetical protein
MITASAAHAVRLGVIIGLLAASLTACASDSKQVLHELRSLPILSQVPPGGLKLGRAQDNGTIAGDQAGIAVVYVSNHSAAELDVLTGQVGQSGDGWFPADRGVDSVMVVLVDPAWHCVAALGFAGE